METGCFLVERDKFTSELFSRQQGHLPCISGVNRDADAAPAADQTRPVPVHGRDVAGSEV